MFDPALAPEGKHLAHVYAAGNEPYSRWEGLNRNSDEYKALKEERSELLWRALEKVIPDVRERVEHACGALLERAVRRWALDVR